MYIADAGDCEICGKLKFKTEKQAKIYKRNRFPKDKSMSAYRCGSYWHIGHHADKYQRYEERHGQRKRAHRSNRARPDDFVRPQLQPVDLDELFGSSGDDHRRSV